LTFVQSISLLELVDGADRDVDELDVVESTLLRHAVYFIDTFPRISEGFDIQVLAMKSERLSSRTDVLSTTDTSGSGIERPQYDKSLSTTPRRTYILSTPTESARTARTTRAAPARRRAERRPRPAHVDATPTPDVSETAFAGF
jgi:hypothetical protein